MKLTKSELAELEGMNKKEADQYEAYCEEQDRLAKLHKEQEEKQKINDAIALLQENGYKVIG